jgi:hypothetical protein
MAQEQLPDDVLRFIADHIDTVPHLEALLLLWETSGKCWRAEDLAARIYVRSDAGIRILKDLEQRKLAKTGADPICYEFDAAWDQTEHLMARIAATYRHHLVRVATIIHAKASPSVREFARAFEIKKER